MAERIQSVFALAKAQERPVFVAYLVAGFPQLTSTVPSMLSLQKGGADIIELGVPFSDPIADGPTIQEASYKALQNGVDLEMCLSMVSDARKLGLKVPVVLMGYYNPFLMYGERKLMESCREKGVDGFIVVDLTLDEARRFRGLTQEYGLSYVPLVTPTTSENRISSLVDAASSFVYVVSVAGVTGARAEVSATLDVLTARIKKYTKTPLVVGFGVATRDHFLKVAGCAEGVVIGSKIVTVMNQAQGDIADAVYDYATSITTRTVTDFPSLPLLSKLNLNETAEAVPEKKVEQVHLLPSRFGDFGGQYAPEALVDCLDEIELAFHTALSDPTFWAEIKTYYPYMNRPSQLHLAQRLTTEAGGANVWLKREDLNHTGSHKINNALGQALLAKRLGKKRIIAETGAGQHGVATATVCAKLGLECVVYMGEEDIRRQALNVFRIKLLGATVVSVKSGSRTLKDAINEAMRDWVTNVETTHYIIGSAIGPHPFPTMVREFQSVIGRESREQMIELIGRVPDVVMACVGGGSNAIGMFHPFLGDNVRLIGVEAGGDGIGTKKHSATLTMGKPGVLHGTRTYLMQNKDGQIEETHSISAGLDYPGVGPEHSYLKDCGRVEYMVATDDESLIGFRKMCELEGIIPALETSHAIFVALQVAKEMKTGDLLICVSGRGDKDVMTVAQELPNIGPRIGWDLRFDQTSII